jgi:hypothetical protein
MAWRAGGMRLCDPARGLLTGIIGWSARLSSGLENEFLSIAAVYLPNKIICLDLWLWHP